MSLFVHLESTKIPGNDTSSQTCVRWNYWLGCVNSKTETVTQEINSQEHGTLLSSRSNPLIPELEQFSKNDAPHGAFSWSWIRV